MSLTLRNTKGTPLTYTEMDDNLTYLETLGLTGGTGTFLPLTGGALTGDLTMDSGTINFGGTDNKISYTDFGGGFDIYNIGEFDMGNQIIKGFSVANGIFKGELAETISLELFSSGVQSIIRTVESDGNKLINLSVNDEGDADTFNNEITISETNIELSAPSIDVKGDLEIANGKVINAASGGGQLDLRYGADNEVMLSNDGGDYSDEFLYLSDGYIELASYKTDSTLFIEAARAVGINGTNGYIGTVTKATNIGGANTFNDVSNVVSLGAYGSTITQSNRVYIKNPVIATEAAPTSTADTSGVQGEIRYDDDYTYIKTSAGWKRSTLSTF